MFKPTLTITKQTIAENYRNCVLEHLYSDYCSLTIEELAEHLECLASDLKGIMNDVDRAAFTKIRSLFQGGSSMMLLPEDLFDEVEKFHHKTNEDFQILITREDGCAIGVIQSVDVNY
jgi:hypothetical protein